MVTNMPMNFNVIIYLTSGLTPLLQEAEYSEEQIKLILSVLIENNIICEMKGLKALCEPMEELSLPNYPNLSVDTFYHLPIIGALNTPKPVGLFSNEYLKLYFCISH